VSEVGESRERKRKGIGEEGYEIRTAPAGNPWGRSTTPRERGRLKHTTARCSAWRRVHQVGVVAHGSDGSDGSDRADRADRADWRGPRLRRGGALRPGPRAPARFESGDLQPLRTVAQAGSRSHPMVGNQAARMSAAGARTEIRIVRGARAKRSGSRDAATSRALNGSAQGPRASLSWSSGPLGTFPGQRTPCSATPRGRPPPRRMGPKPVARP
jgi:hypothetical protein